MRITTNGLVVREQKVNDCDRLITVLTADRGLVTAFADGALRIKSKTVAATGLLCFSTFTFYKGRDTYKVNEATVGEVFFRLRESIQKLTLAQYFCELALKLTPEEEPAGDILRLLLNGLYLLAGELRPPLLIKSAIELRMLVLAGYMPDLSGCYSCESGGDGPFAFNVAEGGLLCESCVVSGGRGFDTSAGVSNPRPPDTTPLPPGVLAAMRHITGAEDSKVFSFTLPENNMKALSDLSEKFLLAQTETVFKTLQFFHSVL